MSYDKGTYKARVLDHYFCQTKSNKDQLRIDFEPTHILGADSQWVPISPDYSRAVFLPFWEESWAETSIKQLRKYAKWDGDDLGELGGQVLVDKSIVVVCEGQQTSPTDGKSYDRFSMPKVDGSPRQAGENNPDVAMRVRNMYSAALKKVKQAESPAPPPPPPPSDEDIPF